MEKKSRATIKLVLVGPESTGKTTLAQLLAEYFKTQWVPEYLREFATVKKHQYNEVVSIEDTSQIIINQLALEQKAQSQGHDFLVYDTDLIQTKIYSEMYFGIVPQELDQATAELESRYYLLCDVDVPWEEDPIRDAPENREQQFEFFKEKLMQYQKPYSIISGTKQERMDKALEIAQAIDLLQAKGLSFEDIQQVQQQGVELVVLAQQFQIFDQGIDFVELSRSASIGDGILQLSIDQEENFIKKFDQSKNAYILEKFVPASGAASRMFSFLTKFLKEYHLKKETINSYINHNNAHELKTFFIGLEKFPFYKEIKAILKSKYPDYKTWPKDQYYYTIVSILMSDQELNYLNLPKGVIPFHKNNTPFLEHILEAKAFMLQENKVKLHYTISESHQHLFDSEIEKARLKFADLELDVRFSYQKKSTDTPVVHLNNAPFRAESGALLFRQAGHGALLENLNELESDLIFIKNIDNVSQLYFEDIVRYKKVLGGYLMSIQERVFDYLNALEESKENLTAEVVEFCQNILHIDFPSSFEKLDRAAKTEFLKSKLNRPIRICGMVKNEGEPGGGPFWVRNSAGEVSLQIIETSQINKADHTQKEILDSASHFNPVDIVCSIKNYKGEKFDLKKFRDDTTGFLTEKSIAGTPIKGMELPGLWNGAMADWISIFIEVPLTTFNPVKTINDLLKPAHQ